MKTEIVPYDLLLNLEPFHLPSFAPRLLSHSEHKEEQSTLFNNSIFRAYHKYVLIQKAKSTQKILRVLILN